ncbi:MAG: OmpH family outer membrane protein [Bryobacterales bacterium]|nr:OmpH family outer membrane protein [Bryobacteraceae bacterium]MDW8353455.1 OmpH family outer membrane protein [Bryobacterales bacterium]
MRQLPGRYLCTIFGTLWLAGAAAGQTKVAVINWQRALLETAELKKAQAELEAKFRPRQEAMAKLQKEIESIQQQLQTMRGKLTDQAEQDLNLQMQRKQREWQRLNEDLQADVDFERNTILSRTGRQMQQIITKLAEEKGLDLVIDAADAHYFRATLDLTQEATAAYDKAHPVK